MGRTTNPIADLDSQIDTLNQTRQKQRAFNPKVLGKLLTITGQIAFIAKHLIANNQRKINHRNKAIERLSRDLGRENQGAANCKAVIQEEQKKPKKEQNKELINEQKKALKKFEKAAKKLQKKINKKNSKIQKYQQQNQGVEQVARDAVALTRQYIQQGQVSSQQLGSLKSTAANASAKTRSLNASSLARKCSIFKERASRPATPRQKSKAKQQQQQRQTTPRPR